MHRLLPSLALVLAACAGRPKIETAPLTRLSPGPSLATEYREEPVPRRRRIPAPGDATGESSLSADGRLVAFASHRGGARRTDDIYVQRADGGGLKRLTRDAGFNVDPAFSHDGKQVAFSHVEDRSVSEIYTVGVADGEIHQVTRLGLISTRPAYHPGDDYLAFVSRAEDHAPASIFVIDRLGRHDPVLVAKDLPGDVRATFEGEEIVWITADPQGHPMRQRARWNDRLARRRLGQRPIAPTANAGARAWVEYLADPYFEGRPTGGARQTELDAGIAAAFASLGLKPLGERFTMPFTFTSDVTLGEKNDLELTIGESSEHLALSGDFVPTSLGAEGEFSPAPISFAGFGLAEEKRGEIAAFDSYGGLDVTDRWVLLFDGLPAGLEGARRFVLHRNGRLLDRALNAQLRGAAGVLLLDDPAIPPRPPRLRNEGHPEGIRIPVLRLSREQGERLFRSEGTSVAAWAERLRGGQTATLPFARASARALVELGFQSALARNVVGRLGVPGATRSIVLLANVDGLGRGERGGSLDAKPDVVLPGANENASGVATLLEVARALTRQPKGLKQNVIFAVTSGSELGALGSRSLARTLGAEPTAALNLDAVGADETSLMALGLSTSADWPILFDGITPKPLAVDELPPDDAGRFAARGVPALTLTTAAAPADRTSLDTPERISFAGITRAAEVAERLARQLASTPGPRVFLRLPK